MNPDDDALEAVVFSQDTEETVVDDHYFDGGDKNEGRPEYGVEDSSFRTPQKSVEDDEAIEGQPCFLYLFELPLAT